MQNKTIDLIARNLGLNTTQVVNTINLLNEGATVPFISRYRKERTGSLDEVQVLQIKEQNDKYAELAWGDSVSAERVAKVVQLNEIAKARGQNMAQLAIAWCAASATPSVTRPTTSTGRSRIASPSSSSSPSTRSLSRKRGLSTVLERPFASPGRPRARTTT